MPKLMNALVANRSNRHLRSFGKFILLLLPLVGVLWSKTAEAQNPQILSLSTTSGVTGTSVQINGLNFGSQQGNSVTFNGVGVTQISNWTTTLITATVPSAATTGPVVVIVNGINSNGVQFTVIPNIVAISPPSGTINTVVQITGTGFGANGCSNCLTFNGTAQNPTLWSDTKLISELPSSLSAGSVSVQIAIGGYASNVVVFTLGTVGTISGTVTQLSNGQAISGASVNLYLFGGLQATTTTASNGTYSLSNVTPNTYSLVFSASGYSSLNTPSVAVVAGGTTTENATLATPSISSLQPSSGPVGTTILINGSNFGPNQGSSTVNFGSIAASPTQWTNSSISVAVPSGASTSGVIVTVGAAVSNSMTFTVGAGTIQGSITSGGTGIVGATVSVLQYGTQKASATSGTGGAYSIGNLAPGKYDMEVIATSYGTQAASGVSATAGNTTTKNFTLSSPGTISGTITQSNGTTGISGATVNVFQGYTLTGSATTNSSGAYTVSSLGAGSYSVTASASGYDTTTKTGQSVTSGGNTTTNISLAGQAAISYSYDEAGRLRSVVDSLNNSALYSYDAAGNITSIGRHTASNIGISEITPNSGPVGTIVNIYGSGFSATPSQNTVTFHNSVTATVTSASPTQLVTTVPVGAVTGTINVTSPAGSATSSSFTVTTSNGLPTITTFSPPIGTPVTISGTNFDPTLSNDTLTVNVTKSLLTSVTGTTTLTTALAGVPTSGHVTVGTTLGTYTTQSYLFVPPPGYSASQVGYTGQVALGGQTTFGLNNPNQIAMVVVDVPASDGLAITTNNTLNSVAYTIYDPTGSVIGSGYLPTGSSYIETTAHISVAGTCTIVIAPGNQTGTFTLGPVAINQDISLPISVDGSAVTVATTTPGQNVHLTFPGYTGERLYLYAYNPTGGKDQFGNGGATIWLYDPSNNTVGEWGAGAPGSTWYLYSGLITLSASGTYSITISAYGLSTWGGTFQLVSVPANPTNTITVTNPGQLPAPVTIATQKTGQSAYLTFSGSQNERLYLYVYNPTGTADQYGNAGATIWLLDPNNQTIGEWGAGAPNSSWYLYSGMKSLGATGTQQYTIKILPYGMSTWGGTFQLVTVPADVTTPISVSPAIGPPAPVTLATQYIGQSGHLTFQGSPGQRLFMWAYNPTGTADQYGNQGSGIWLHDPSGNTILYWGGGNPGSNWWGYSGLITLNPPQPNETYSIDFTANGMSLWGATFQLVTVPPDPTINNMTLNTPAVLSTSYTGQSGELYFNNTVQNQQVYLYVYNPTGTADQYGDQGSGIWFNDPSGNTILYWGGGNPGSNWFGCSSAITLQSTNTYTIKFTPSLMSLWGATFELMSTPCP